MIKQVSLCMCLLTLTNTALAQSKIIQWDSNSNPNPGSKIIELNHAPEFLPKYKHTLDLRKPVVKQTPVIQEEKPSSYKEGPAIYVSSYTLSSGVVIKHCMKIPMKYRVFDKQHTHLKCANGIEYYVK
jgi:hypothetical protein